MTLMAWIAFGSAALWLGLLIFGWMLGKRWDLPIGLVYFRVGVSVLEALATFFHRFHRSAALFQDNWEEMRSHARPGTEQEARAVAWTVAVDAHVNGVAEERSAI